MDYASKPTGQPSDKYFKLLSVMLEHECKLMAVSLEQYLLMDCVDISVIFLQSDRSKCSILWQWFARVLKYIHSYRINVLSCA